MANLAPPRYCRNTDAKQMPHFAPFRPLQTAAAAHRFAQNVQFYRQDRQWTLLASLYRSF